MRRRLDPKRLLRRQGVPNSYTDLHRVCDWRILEDWGIIYTYIFTCIWLNYLGNVDKYASHTLSVGKLFSVRPPKFNMELSKKVNFPFPKLLFQVPCYISGFSQRGRWGSKEAGICLLKSRTIKKPWSMFELGIWLPHDSWTGFTLPKTNSKSSEK